MALHSCLIIINVPFLGSRICPHCIHLANIIVFSGDIARACESLLSDLFSLFDDETYRGRKNNVAVATQEM